jgi:hypothetical protein
MLVIESVTSTFTADALPSSPPYVMEVVVIGPQADKGWVVLNTTAPVPGGTAPGTIIFRSPDVP